MLKKYKTKADKYIKSHLPNPIPAFRLNIYSPSYSGKSYLINKLLTENKYGYNRIFKGDQIFIFSPTFETDESYKELRTKMEGYEDHIYEDYDEDVIDAIISHQKKKKKEKEAKPMLLLIDDLVSKIDNNQKKSLIDLYMTGRHKYISIIMTSQQYKYMPKPMRINASDIIIFPNNMNSRELRDIADEMPNDEVKDYIDYIKENATDNNHYDFLYINMKKPKNKRYFMNMWKILNVKDLD